MAADDPPSFLLLLPPVPSPPTAAAFNVAFGESISQVLEKVSPNSSESRRGSVLDIALTCPHLVRQEKTPRSSLYAQTQTILAAVYKLVVVIATKEGIDVEDSEGVDVRVLLTSWSSQQSATDEQPYGPVISMQTLAKSGRAWQRVFAIESEPGESMAKAYIAAKGWGEQITRVKSGPVLHTQDPTRAGDDHVSTAGMTAKVDTSNTKHAHVAVGGTFDHIHIGHKLLLTMTIFAVDQDQDNRMNQGERSATIGITGDQLLKNKKHAEVLESWEDRYKAVMAFVNALVDFSPPSNAAQRHVSIRDDPGPYGKSKDVYYPTDLVVKCTEIQDPFGPPVVEERISALVISAETRKGAQALNEKRKENGLMAMDVFEVDVLDAEDDDGKAKEGFESKLSSTAIREKIAKKRQSSL